MVKLIELTGQQFERLTVLSRAGNTLDGKALWRCQCSCGKVVDTAGRLLRSGRSKSCGCYKAERLGRASRTHGLYLNRSPHPLMNIWKKMIARCYDESDPNYPGWGGRGITVCRSWRDSPLNFVADMHPRPPGTTLDRVNNDGPYSPSNCRWSSHKSQNNNRRDNVLVDFNGEWMTVAQAESASGISRWLLYYRVKRGMTGARLFAMPR